MSDRQPPGDVYELTIVGAPGPALCQALQPFTAALSEVQTIVSARVGEGTDLVDLLGALDARGLEVADIVELR